MNFKNMKVVLLLALALGVGMIGKAGAFYTTVRSTAVYISSAATYPNGMELLSVSYSTGSSTFGDQFIAVMDTVAVEGQISSLGQTLKGGTTLQGVSYTNPRYPIEQRLIPPIVVFTTAPSNNPTGGSTGFTRIDLRDNNGCGIPVTEGIEVLQPGVAYGTVVTVEWRPMPIQGPCKQQ